MPGAATIAVPLWLLLTGGGLCLLTGGLVAYRLRQAPNLKGRTPVTAPSASAGGDPASGAQGDPDRKRVVSGKSVSDRVDLGGSRLMKKTNNKLHMRHKQPR